METAEFNNTLYQFPALVPWKLYLSMSFEAQEKAISIASCFRRTPKKYKTKDKKRFTA